MIFTACHMLFGLSGQEERDGWGLWHVWERGCCMQGFGGDI